MKKKASERRLFNLVKNFGAGNQIRTGDLLHGKQTLYQLSYTRMNSKVLLILKNTRKFVN